MNLLSKIFTLTCNSDFHSQKRIEILDFLRGFAMILVLMHHAGAPGSKWIIAFHMPFFFILSGYTESVRKTSVLSVKFTEYLKKRFIRLIVPYFAFELVNFLIYVFLRTASHAKIDIFASLVRIILCLNPAEFNGEFNRLWFLPCIFICDILYYFIAKLTKSKISMLYISVLLFIFSYIITRSLNSRLPFTIDIAVMATAFMILGYVGNNIITFLIREKHIITDILCVLTMSLVLYYVYLGDAHMYMFSNDYGEYIFSVTGALAGSAVCFVIAKYLYFICEKIGLPKKIFIWYGLNSLACFPVHLQINYILKCAVEILCHLGLIKFISLPWYIVFVSMLVFTVPVVNFITLFLPFMLGRFKPLKNN